MHFVWQNSKRWKAKINVIKRETKKMAAEETGVA